MTRTLIKDLLREIRKSKGRFLSIMLIIAIGVAFFAGIKATAPTMRSSADMYYDDYNLMDLRIVSTYGLDDNDLNKIREVEGIEEAYHGYSKDVLASRGDNQFVLKLINIPGLQSKINKPLIIEGRLPTNKEEIALNELMIKSNLSIGDKITISTDAEDNTIVVKEFTIVGFVQSPYYISFDYGSTNIGRGSVDMYGLVADEVFDMPYYNEVFATIKGAKELNSYDEEYFESFEDLITELEAIGKEQAKVRYDEIYDKSKQELDDARKKYDEGVITYESGIKTGEEQLKTAEDELLLGVIKLEANKAAVNQTIISNKMQLEILKGLIDELNGDSSQKNEIQKQIDETNNQINTQQIIVDNINRDYPNLDNDIAQLEANEGSLTPAQQQQLELLRSKQTEKSNAQTQINSLNAIKTQFQRILDGLNETNSSLILEYDNLQKELDAAQLQADTEFAKAQKEIDDGYIELAKGKVQFELEKKKGLMDLEDGKNKIEEGQALLDSMPDPKWYVLDRNSHQSYREYGSAADQMEALGKVFPLFFFLVAALVCLTTMTRMVDEQRQNIGTLKALGYSKLVITIKYLLYGLLASLVGSILGIVVGLLLFPGVIFNAWNMMYTVPKIKYAYESGVIVSTFVIATSVTSIATIFAVYREMMEVPAILMRPKAPKAGKRILLERVGFIWKRLSFTSKVTARNIVRYKKRFFMTIIGVAGCSALIVAGFGIRDSISTIVTKQFNEIYQYDLAIEFDPSISSFEKEELFEDVKNIDGYNKGLMIRQELGQFDANDKTYSTTIVVSSDENILQEMIAFRDYKTKEELKIDNQKVIVTEKIAKDLGISVDDSFTIKDANDRNITMTVGGIAENYISHTIYMSNETYKSIYGYVPNYNYFFVSAETNEGFINLVHSNEKLKSMTLFESIINTFEDTIKSFNFIIIVLIISAGLLAFVVLYNLSNVNITERTREIATIKVLGFYPKEVSSYINREIIILTLLGSLVGLALGRLLHLYIMEIVEVDQMMFTREILPTSYLIAVVITLVFSLIVNKVMSKKLKDVKMVESLKSID